MADHWDPIYDPRTEPPRTWEDHILEREMASEAEAYRLAEEYWAEQEALEPWERPEFEPSYRNGYTPGGVGYSPPPRSA